MRKLMIATVVVGMSALFALHCEKESSDNTAAQAAALLLAQGTNVCDRTQKSCIQQILNGSTWIMTGNAQQPQNQLGFAEATATAAGVCYNQTRVVAASGGTSNDSTFTVSNILGTTSGTCPTCTCDENTAQGSTFGAETTSTAVAITPVSAECFNITVSYGTLVQVGRGNVSADGTTWQLEVYRQDGNPSGHTCADGPVGQATGLTYTFNANAGTATTNWDAVQVYSKQ